MTATLHIEHPVRDFDAWKAVFDGFAAFRVEHGVRSYRVARDVATGTSVSIDLTFGTVEEAEHFHRLLAERVWSRQQAEDLLTARPDARVLAVVEDTLVRR